MSKSFFDKIMDMDSNLSFLAIFILLLIIVINGFFWLEVSNTNAENCFFESGENNCVVFDGHNLELWQYLIISIVVLELIFLILLIDREKQYYESWKTWVLELKLKALGYTFLIYIILPLFWFIWKVIILLRNNWDKVKDGIIGMLIIWGVIGVVIVWYLINVVIAKKLGNTKERKFEVGEKVRVREDLEKGETYGNLMISSYLDDNTDFKGKKVTIKEYKKLKNNKEVIKIKEDKGKDYWSEEMFEKLKGGKNERRI